MNPKRTTAEKKAASGSLEAAHFELFRPLRGGPEPKDVSSEFRHGDGFLVFYLQGTTSFRHPEGLRHILSQTPPSAMCVDVATLPTLAGSQPKAANDGLQLFGDVRELLRGRRHLRHGSRLLFDDGRDALGTLGIVASD